MSARADELARHHTERAIATLAEIMEDPIAEDKDRIKAASEILDRGHGKASQAIIAVPATREQRQLLAALSDAELMKRITSTPLPSLADMRVEPIDAEFAEAPDPLLG